MWSLADVQAHVRQAVTGGDALNLAIPLVGGLEPARRLDIHRRHYEASLVAALRAKYPASAWLVGDHVMKEAARAFVRSTPPRRPCIAEYGDEFPAFLAQQPGLTALPYIQSFAELELSVAHVSIAIDRPAATWSRVTAINDPEALLASTVSLQPGIRYHRSEWPIDELMSMYLSDSAPETYVLHPSSRWLEVRGARGELRIDRLDPASFTFRRALVDGQSLGEACETALDWDPAFDAGQALAALITAQMVVDVGRPTKGREV